jgi:hypothetical protein
MPGQSLAVVCFLNCDRPAPRISLRPTQVTCIRDSPSKKPSAALQVLNVTEFPVSTSCFVYGGRDAAFSQPT